MARPRFVIDKEQFEKLCSIQCTLEEISGFFGCSEDTIERWCERTYKERFADIYAKKRGLGKISLRRSQFRMAETNPTMAIWLGKQYLGQTERIEYEDKEALQRLDEILNGIRDNTQRETE